MTLLIASSQRYKQQPCTLNGSVDLTSTETHYHLCKIFCWSIVTYTKYLFEALNMLDIALVQYKKQLSSLWLLSWYLYCTHAISITYYRLALSGQITCRDWYHSYRILHDSWGSVSFKLVNQIIGLLDQISGDLVDIHVGGSNPVFLLNREEKIPPVSAQMPMWRGK